MEGERAMVLKRLQSNWHRREKFGPSKATKSMVGQRSQNVSRSTCQSFWRCVVNTVEEESLPYKHTYASWLRDVRVLRQPVVFAKLRGCIGWTRIRYAVWEQQRKPAVSATKTSR